MRRAWLAALSVLACGLACLPSLAVGPVTRRAEDYPAATLGRLHGPVGSTLVSERANLRVRLEEGVAAIGPAARPEEVWVRLRPSTKLTGVQEEWWPHSRGVGGRCASRTRRAGSSWPSTAP